MSDDMIIEHLKKRITQSKQELANVVQQRKAAQEIESMLLKEIEGYESTLAAEARRSGIPTEIEAPSVTEPSSNGHQTNATQAIYNYIRATSLRGITRSEIRDRLEKDSIHVHRNYPYVVLAKLKEAHKIREENDRFFAL